MRIVKIVAISTTVLLLTIISQVGGIIYLCSRLTYPFLRRRIRSKGMIILAKLVSFLALYFIVCFTIIPPLAGIFGRVPLPVGSSGNLRSLNTITFLLNRHYVNPELNDLAIKVGDQLNKSFPGTKTLYLDANFPFLNGFPLIPHLSHNDGRKLDLAFFYLDKATGKRTEKVPSPIGYGICEEPRPGEVNTAEFCNEKGYWQYSALKKVVPQGTQHKFIFDSLRTREMVSLFVAQNQIGKIFIEPHLVQRLQLQNSKIRFHGCGAVRHDDHLHIQLR